MATSNEAHGTMELLPPEVKTERLQLAGIKKSFENLDLLDRNMNGPCEIIKTLQIKTKEDCARMKECVAELKPIEKMAEAEVTPYKVILDRMKKMVQMRLQKVVNRSEEHRGIANKKISDWEIADEAARQREQREHQRKVDEQNRKQAEEQLKLDTAAAKLRKEEAVAQIRKDLKAGKITKAQAEKQLRAAGAQEEADKTRAAIEAEEKKAAPPTVEVKSNAPKVSGTVARVNYFAVHTDAKTFIAEFVRRYNAGKLLETVIAVDHNGDPTQVEINWADYIAVNDQSLGQTARQLKSTEKMTEYFPGIKASSIRTY
jgi:Fe-S cluster assembly scaffold protein SufB